MGGEEIREKNVKDFIEYMHKKHPYGRYCEILVDKDGMVILANPSHLYALIQLYGVPKFEIFNPDNKKLQEVKKLIPISANAVQWLSEYLNCGVIWYSQIILPPNYTKAQIKTLGRLISENIINRDFYLNIAVEKSHIDLIEAGKYKNINDLHINARGLEQKAKIDIQKEVDIYDQIKELEESDKFPEEKETEKKKLEEILNGGE